VTAAGLPEVIAPGDMSLATIDVTFTSDRAGGEASTLELVHDGRGAMSIPLSGVGRLTSVPSGDLADTKIAFVRTSGPTKDIYVVDPDGTSEILLSDGLTDDWNPTWSPDGTQIAFQTDRDGDREIYVMNADGTSQVNLTNSPTKDDQTPVWSPDGSQIVYMSLDGDYWDIYVMNADGTGQTSVTNTPMTDEYRPTWSPDSSRIVFSFYDDVYILANPVCMFQSMISPSKSSGDRCCC
jgi:Tol biopolymer transport system component